MNNSSLHMKWIIFILGCLLIGSLSVSWSTLQEIPNIISIALGLSSLVLAVMAIVQSLVGNSTLTTVLTSITSAAGQAEAAARSVEDSTRHMHEKLSAFDSIPSSINDVRARLEEIAATSTQNITEQIQDPTTGRSSSTGTQEKLIDMFNGGTNGAILSFYIACKSYRTSKSFDPSDIIESPYTAGVINGYILAIKSADFISAQYVSGSFIVNSIDDYFCDKVLEIMGDSVSNEFLQNQIARVNSFFDGTITDPVVSTAGAQ